MTDPLPPRFALDALQETEPTHQLELLELVHRLPDALPTVAAPAGLRARLLEETGRAPERYMPFTGQLADLYDISREEVGDLLARSADPRQWRGSGLPGIKKLAVRAGPRTREAQSYLVQFAAGARFPEHRHDGRETVLLLAGSYTEDGGRVYSTGDVHVMEPGTAHAFTIAKDEDCVAASVLYGKLNFRSLPLRLLARVLGH